MIQKIVLSIILTCVLAFAGGGRGYGFLMLDEPIGVRKISMGSVGTALGGDGFRYYNPVAPFFSAHPYTAVEFGRMPGGVNKGGFESALIFPTSFAAVGFYSSSVDFETRDEKGFGSAASSSTTIGSIGAGFIRDRLAVGVSAQMVQDRIWIVETYNAVTLSAGIGYTLFDGKLNLGAAGFHGFANSWQNSKSSSSSPVSVGWGDELVPRFARAGAAWMDTIKTFPFTAAADIVYRDDSETISVPVGAEVWVLPSIALRIGKRFGWESEIFSLGIGFNVDRISFDAAFVPSALVDDYDLKWSMGLSYNLGGRRRDRTPEPSKVSQEEFDRQDEVEDKHQQLQEELNLDERKIDIGDEVLDDDKIEVVVIDDEDSIETEEEQRQPLQEEIKAAEEESVAVDEVIVTGDEDSEGDEDEQSHPQEETGLDEQE
ncbi:MAG: hypothetical protein FWE57_12000 [Chitinispirillia bacterium]|nr:hypothetical protein [Chitinispirillia bacterium]